MATAIEEAVTLLTEAVTLCEQMLGAMLIDEEDAL